MIDSKCDWHEIAINVKGCGFYTLYQKKHIWSQSIIKIIKKKKLLSISTLDYIYIYIIKRENEIASHIYKIMFLTLKIRNYQQLYNIVT